MRRCWFFAAYALGLALFCRTDAPVRAADPSPTAGEFFEKSVRPILANHCFECHGAKKQKAGLRLDSRDGMLTGGDTGPALVPGHPEQSLLIKAISYKDELRMPPKGQLAPAQIATLTNWIKQGAVWPQTPASVRPAKDAGFKITPEDRAFWSFQPIADPKSPTVKNNAWVQTPIDAFILAKLEEKGLTPAPPADPRTLLRRMYFDVIGLPPTPVEVEEFVAAWEAASAKRQALIAAVVDRLLASPHYGERWARHWLDVARYGEDQAHTFQARKYPQGYRYRDWLVKAFNDDMPYDRFIKEQLAADLLPRSAGASRLNAADSTPLPLGERGRGEGRSPDPNENQKSKIDNLPALGFFALGPVYYGDPKRLDQFDDRIDTLSRGLLGLTVACARCHDHKFDPISTKDYYSLAGVIASTEYVEVSLEPGKEGQPVAPPKKDDKNKKPAPPGPFIHAVKEGQPANLKVHIRGNPSTLGEEAPRRMMAILTHDAAPIFTKGSGRLELANAIAAKDNPLTARVMVNRIWQHHFGKGIVRTPSNFGELGERPTHPELLDYLTSRFITSGWSVKAMHRMMLLSATYQQGVRGQESGVSGPGSSPMASNASHGDAATIDPENRLLWHMSRRRLEVEAWRDAMLSVAGKLDRSFGGPSSDLANADNRRRTLYGSVSRHELNPLLRLFDFPDPNITADERVVTTVPLQQLYVLNSEFLIGNAKALAARLATAANDDDGRIRHAFMLLYGRPAAKRDVAMGLEYLTSATIPQQGAAVLTRWEQYAQVLLSTNEFMYVD